MNEAKERGINIHKLLREKAMKCKPGESGLLALDWWSGYDTIFEAAEHMAKVKEEYYKPNPRNVGIYKKLYDEYKVLHDYFGRGANDIMKRLKKIKTV